MHAGQIGQAAFDLRFPVLFRGLSKASLAAVMQTLQSSVVPAGTLFSAFLEETNLCQTWVASGR